MELGFVRQFRPRLLVTSDRSPIASRSMFVGSDRTWLPTRRKSLTSAFARLSSVPMGSEPSAAVTSREHRSPAAALECGPKKRTFAVSSHERNHRIGHRL